MRPKPLKRRPFAPLGVGLLAAVCLMMPGAGEATVIESGAAADAGGSYVLVWRDDVLDDVGDIYAWIHSPQFVGPRPYFLVNDDQGGVPQTQPVASLSASGSFVVVWVDGRDGRQVFGQRYDGEGLPHGPNFAVSVAEDADPFDPNVVMNADANYAVAWIEVKGWEGEGDDARLGDLWVRTFGPDGVPLSEPRRFGREAGVAFRSRPALAAAGKNSFVIAWAEDHSDSRTIYAQRFDTRARAIGSKQPVLVAAEAAAPVDRDDAGDIGVAAQADGSFVVAWRQDSGHGPQIWVRRFNRSLRPQGDARLASRTAPVGRPARPAIAMGGDGSVAVAWEYALEDGSNPEIWGQCMDARVEPIGGSFRVDSCFDGPADPRCYCGSLGIVAPTTQDINGSKLVFAPKSESQSDEQEIEYQEGQLDKSLESVLGEQEKRWHQEQDEAAQAMEGQPTPPPDNPDRSLARETDGGPTGGYWQPETESVHEPQGDAGVVVDETPADDSEGAAAIATPTPTRTIIAAGDKGSTPEIQKRPTDAPEADSTELTHPVPEGDSDNLAAARAAAAQIAAQKAAERQAANVHTHGDDDDASADLPDMFAAASPTPTSAPAEADEFQAPPADTEADARREAQLAADAAAAQAAKRAEDAVVSEDPDRALADHDTTSGDWTAPEATPAPTPLAESGTMHAPDELDVAPEKDPERDARIAAAQKELDHEMDDASDEQLKSAEDDALQKAAALARAEAARRSGLNETESVTSQDPDRELGEETTTDDSGSPSDWTAQPEPTPTPTATRIARATPTAVPAIESTPVARATPTKVAHATPRPHATPEEASEDVHTEIGEPYVTDVPGLSGTGPETVEATPTPARVPAIEDTPIARATPTSVPAIEDTPVARATPTSVPAIEDTPVARATPLARATPTRAPVDEATPVLRSTPLAANTPTPVEDETGGWQGTDYGATEATPVAESTSAPDRPAVEDEFVAPAAEDTPVSPEVVAAGNELDETMAEREREERERERKAALAQVEQQQQQDEAIEAAQSESDRIQSQDPDKELAGEMSQPSGTDWTAPVETATPVAKATPTPARTPTRVAKATPVFAPTATPVAASTPVAEATAAADSTPVSRPTPEATATPTQVARATPTAAHTPTWMSRATPKPTVTPMRVAKATPVFAPTATPETAETSEAAVTPEVAETPEDVESTHPAAGQPVDHSRLERGVKRVAESVEPDETQTPEIAGAVGDQENPLKGSAKAGSATGRRTGACGQIGIAAFAIGLVLAAAFFMLSRRRKNDVE